MRNLFLLSAIATFSLRANADRCPQGYEPVGVSGAWPVCQPITDPQRCEPIFSQSVCDYGMGFYIGSHMATCQRRISVLNDRCAANKAVAKAQTKYDTVCRPATPAHDKTCTAAARALLRAQQSAREVHERTERLLRQPISGGGRGLHILL